MKKIIASALLLGLSLTAIAEEKPLLTVNGAAISEAMLQQLAQSVIKPGMKVNQQVQHMLVSELINRVILSQAAVADKLDQDPVNTAGLEMARISFLAQLALKKQMESFKPSDEAVKALYEKEYGEPTSEYKARHILHKEEKEAKASIAELKKGTNFAELAKKKSTGPTGAQGGDLGWFSAERMAKPFSDAVAGMKPGAFTDTPVKTKFGWHVILLEETRELAAKPLDQVKPLIAAQLRQQAMQDYLQELRDKADIKAETP